MDEITPIVQANLDDIGVRWAHIFGIRNSMIMFLDYIANGKPYKDLVRLYNIAKGRAHAIIDGMIRIVVLLNTKYIFWPSQREKEATKRHYMQTLRIYGLVRHIDGTHIKCSGMSSAETKQDFTNRKFDFSLNLTCV